GDGARFPSCRAPRRPPLTPIDRRHAYLTSRGRHAQDVGRGDSMRVRARRVVFSPLARSPTSPTMPSANLTPHSRLPHALIRCALLGLFLLAHSSIGAQSSAPVRPSRARSPIPTARACDTSWSAPRALLTRDGLRIYVEGPSAVTTSRGLVLTGSPTVG